jgi:hypothetical protein
MSRRRSKLVKIAESLGETPETLLPRLVSEKGSIYAAAAELGVAHYAVSKRMRAMGYQPRKISRVEWVLQPEGNLERELTHA